MFGNYRVMGSDLIAKDAETRLEYVNHLLSDVETIQFVGAGEQHRYDLEEKISESVELINSTELVFFAVPVLAIYKLKSSLTILAVSAINSSL